MSHYIRPLIAMRPIIPILTNGVHSIKIEMNFFNKLDTWYLLLPPSGRKAIRAKRVIDVNRDVVGDIVQYKADFVANIFSQMPENDFQKDYSAVTSYATVRFFFSWKFTVGYKRSLPNDKYA